MDPEDIVVEAIAAASLHGDSPDLRILMCSKMRETMKRLGFHLERDSGRMNAEKT